MWRNVFHKNAENILVDIVYESEDHNEIKRKEQEFVELYGRIDLGTGSLVNLSSGGDNSYLALGQAKSTFSNKGKPLPPEHRRRIGLANKGRIVSLETRRLIASKRIGKRHTSATKQKLSEIGRGKQICGDNPFSKAVSQYDVSGNVWIADFDCVVEAARVTNKPVAGIYKCVSGKSKTSGGFVWKLKEEK